MDKPLLGSGESDEIYSARYTNYVNDKPVSVFVWSANDEGEHEDDFQISDLGSAFSASAIKEILRQCDEEEAAGGLALNKTIKTLPMDGSKDLDFLDEPIKITSMSCPKCGSRFGALMVKAWVTFDIYEHADYVHACAGEDSRRWFCNRCFDDFPLEHEKVHGP